MTNTDKRADYIKGLRALADLLETHDELPLPSTGHRDAFDWWLPWDVEDAKATMATIARLLPGEKKKTVGELGGSAWFTLAAQLHGLRIDVNASRENVCTRVVTGTREITEEIPDPDALAAVPTTTVTRTEEIIDWIYEPILADREQVSA